MNKHLCWCRSIKELRYERMKETKGRMKKKANEIGWRGLRPSLAMKRFVYTWHLRVLWMMQICLKSCAKKLRFKIGNISLQLTRSTTERKLKKKTNKTASARWPLSRSKLMNCLQITKWCGKVAQTKPVVLTKVTNGDPFNPHCSRVERINLPHFRNFVS